MKDSIILKKHEQLIKKESNIDSFINESHRVIDSIAQTNSVITKCYDMPEYLNADLPLAGSVYSLKDNIITKGIRTTGGSKFLENFIPSYDSTIYTLLKHAGAILTCKSNLDEFGMAGTGLASSYGDVRNVLDESRITAGSSSGSVNLIAAHAVDFSFGTDTGDSIRRPSSFLGVVGYKPSYGLISRYGVLPYAPSLDHVGIIANSVADVAIVADVVCQYDPKDYTSQKLEHNFYKDLTNLPHMRISVIKGIDQAIQPDERKIYLNVLDILKANGHNIIEKEVDSNLLDMIGVTYQVISNVEGISCYSSFTGIPFGESIGGKNYQELVLNNRTKFINNQSKKRMLMGAYITSLDNFEEIYLKAKKTRTLLINLMNSLIDGVDALLIPSASGIAPTIDDTINGRTKSTHADDALVLGNFAGTPSITIPAGKFNNMPYGININCKQKHDQKMFNVAYTIESLLGGKNE